MTNTQTTSSCGGGNNNIDDKHRPVMKKVKKEQQKHKPLNFLQINIGVCGSVAGIAFSIPALYMLVVLVVLLAASLTAVSSKARRD